MRWKMELILEAGQPVVLVIGDRTVWTIIRERQVAGGLTQWYFKTVSPPEGIPDEILISAGPR
jgi:hypothetical protein